MGDLKHALRDGGMPDAATALLGNAHIWVGIAVLALTVIRLLVRAKFGVPAPLPTSRAQELAARGVHGLLYLLMLLAPITGLLAWYGGIHTAEEIHELSKPFFIVLIAATYTPFLQAGWNDPFLFGLLIAIWAAAFVGIALKVFWPGRYDRLAILFYLGMGWSGVMAAGPLTPYLSTTTLSLIVIGGIIYSAGVIFHIWEKLRFQNAIWHTFVVTAALVHYCAVFTCVVIPVA